jgi:hypothetical protein
VTPASATVRHLARVAVVIVAAATCYLAFTVTAVADPRCDGQSCVPGVGHGAVLGQPCSNPDRYIFSTTDSGDLVACATAGAAPRWVNSGPLVGVRDEKSPCAPNVGGEAQSPDGLPLLCVFNPANGSGYWLRGP